MWRIFPAKKLLGCLKKFDFPAKKLIKKIRVLKIRMRQFFFFKVLINFIFIPLLYFYCLLLVNKPEIKCLSFAQQVTFSKAFICFQILSN